MLLSQYTLTETLSSLWSLIIMVYLKMSSRLDWFASQTVRGNTLTETTHPHWPDTIITVCVSYFTTRGKNYYYQGSSTELTSHHQLEEFRKGQKETPHSDVPPLPRILLASIHPGSAMSAPPRRTLSQINWTKTNLETNPITNSLRLWDWVTWQSCYPGIPYPPASHPIKSLALLVPVSPHTIHSWMLDKSLLSGPERGYPCNKAV